MFELPPPVSRLEIPNPSKPQVQTVKISPTAKMARCLMVQTHPSKKHYKDGSLIVIEFISPKKWPKINGFHWGYNIYKPYLQELPFTGPGWGFPRNSPENFCGKELPFQGHLHHLGLDSWRAEPPKNDGPG